MERAVLWIEYHAAISGSVTGFTQVRLRKGSSVLRHVLGAGDLEHPLADRHDQAGFLGERDEAIGLQ
jgi:hypothetical protein